MEKQSVARRILFPAGLALGIMIVSVNVYKYAGNIESGVIQGVVVYLSAVGMFATIWLGPLFVNSMAFFRGATLPERFLASFVVPVAWIAKTYTFFIGLFSVGELVFLILHPLILGNIGVNLLCVGVSEIVCRQRARARGMRVRLFEAPHMAALVAGMAITFAGLWNGGHTYYYYYMDVYAWLFM